MFFYNHRRLANYSGADSKGLKRFPTVARSTRTRSWRIIIVIVIDSGPFSFRPRARLHRDSGRCVNRPIARTIDSPIITTINGLLWTSFNSSGLTAICNNVVNINSNSVRRTGFGGQHCECCPEENDFLSLSGFGGGSDAVNVKLCFPSSRHHDISDGIKKKK